MSFMGDSWWRHVWIARNSSEFQNLRCYRCRFSEITAAMKSITAYRKGIVQVAMSDKPDRHPPPVSTT